MKVIRDANGAWVWKDYLSSEISPIATLPLMFSTQSARKAMEQFKAARNAIQRASRHPDAPYDERKDILSWLHDPAHSSPERSPFICYVTPAQWRAISMGLRDWTGGPANSVSTMVNLAFRRGRMALLQGEIIYRDWKRGGHDEVQP